MVKMFEYIQSKPAILTNGFRAASISEVLGINEAVDSKTNQ